MTVQREIHFKELAHTIVGAGKPNLCRPGQQANTTEELMSQLQSKVCR